MGKSDLSAIRSHYDFSEPVTKDLNSDTEMANHRGKKSQTPATFTDFVSLLSILLQPEEKIRNN